MNDSELEKLYQAKGKQTQDITRLKKLAAVSFHLEPPRTLMGLTPAKCPKCDAPLVKEKITVSKEEIIFYSSCRNLDCPYEYAISKKLQPAKSLF